MSKETGNITDIPPSNWQTHPMPQVPDKPIDMPRVTDKLTDMPHATDKHT